MLKTYNGSCQCGAVRFIARIDLAAGTSRCNCSMCRKSRMWKAVILAEDFHLQEGAGLLADYRFNSGSIGHRFCTACGVKVLGDIQVPELGHLVAVNVACLDDASDEELAAAPVEFQDGREDRQDRAPEISSYL